MSPQRNFGRAKSKLTATLTLVIVLALLTLAIIQTPVFGEEVPFDRERCLAECRSDYGFENEGFGSYESEGQMSLHFRAAARAYRKCIQECEKKAWERFDQEFNRPGPDKGGF
jgi:hypothetical protein